ncbi:hypothetical protein [Luteolibacter sp. AS25]|uniref:hypothetical protein n=1 Tax=Luteolibacter sp. AS25 TaxID=3135776 RepID=UPI00398B0E4B
MKQNKAEMATPRNPSNLIRIFSPARHSYNVLQGNEDHKPAFSMKLGHLLISLALSSFALHAQQDPKPPSVAKERRDNFTAGDRQELLSPTAALAIEEQDIQLLEHLHPAGWNPSAPLGRMPDPRNNMKLTPLTLAVTGGKERSLHWLLNTCKVSAEARDLYGMRGIDWMTSEIEFGDDDSSPDLAIVNLLKRDARPVEKDALSQLIHNISQKSGHAMRLHSVNDEKPGAIWDNFEEALSMEQREERERNAPNDSEDTDQNLEEKTTKAVDDLTIQWTRIDDNAFKFSFTTSSHAMSGGGMSGHIYIKYGYWLSSVENSWDN